MSFRGLKVRRNKRKRKEMLADYIMYKATKLLAGSCEKRQCIKAVNVATIKGSRQTRSIKFDMAEMSSCKKHTKNDKTNEQAIAYNILPCFSLLILNFCKDLFHYFIFQETNKRKHVTRPYLIKRMILNPSFFLQLQYTILFGNHGKLLKTVSCKAAPFEVRTVLNF
jgi:hypothetical protein